MYTCRYEQCYSLQLHVCNDVPTFCKELLHIFIYFLQFAVNWCTTYLGMKLWRCRFLHNKGQWNAPSHWSYEYSLIHITDCHVPELTSRTNIVTGNMEHIVAVLKRRRIEPAQYPPPLCGPTYILQFFCNNVRIGPALSGRWTACILPCHPADPSPTQPSRSGRTTVRFAQ